MGIAAVRIGTPRGGNRKPEADGAKAAKPRKSARLPAQAPGAGLDLLGTMRHATVVWRDYFDFFHPGRV